MNKYQKDREDIFNTLLRNSKVVLKVIDRKLRKSPNDLELFLMKSYFIQGTDNKEALRLAEYIVEKAPHNIGAYLQIADVYTEEKKYKKAVEAYRRAIEVFKKLLVLDKSPNSQSLYEDEIKDARKKIRELRPHLDGTFKKKPISQRKRAIQRANRRKMRDDLINLKYEARELEEKGRLQQSMKVAERMMELYHDSPMGYMQAGDLFKIMKKYDKALYYYQRAINLLKVLKARKVETSYEGQIDDLIQDIRNEIKEIPTAKLKTARVRMKKLFLRTPK